MSYLDFKGVVDFARAHGMAVEAAGGRQAHVTMQFYKTNAKVYAFPVCLGSCPKCDKVWVVLRTELACIEVVQVRTGEASSPSEPVELPS